MDHGTVHIRSEDRHRLKRLQLEAEETSGRHIPMMDLLHQAVDLLQAKAEAERDAEA